MNKHKPWMTLLAFTIGGLLAASPATLAQVQSSTQDSLRREAPQGSSQLPLGVDTVQRPVQQSRDMDARQGDTNRSSLGLEPATRHDTVQGSAGTSMQPDNTGMNKRDKDSGTMTSDEQGQSKSDIQITRSIRRSIINDDSLSMYAHNIKIITKDGTVTLRGPVKSAQEKAAIEAKAAAVAGAGKVKNEIEVKTENQGTNRH